MTKDYPIPAADNRGFWPKPPVWRELNGSIRAPVAPLVQFEHVSHAANELEVITAAYVVQEGPTFRAKRVLSRWSMLPSEWRHAPFEASCQAMADIRDQVRAYNAAILPIDNGPDPFVYLAETCTRVADAVAAARDGQPDHQELIASCRANSYAGNMAVAYFNRPTTTTERT